jgi:ELWxxDGT repeat protein
MLSGLSALRRRRTARRRALRNCLPVVFEPLELRRLLSAAMLVTDINPGTGSGFYDGGSQAALGSQYFFAGNDGTHGVQPWVSNGTATGTFMLADINPSGNSNPTDFTLGNGVIYFTAFDGNTTQIWQSNGTTAGTTKVTNFSENGGDTPYQLIYSYGTLFFTDINDDGDDSVWATNGTFGAEHELKDFGQGQNNSDAGLIAAYNGTLYFEGGPSQTLWTGNATTTTALPATGVLGSVPTAYNNTGIFFNGQLYFTIAVSNGYQLWTSNGTTASQVGNTTFSSVTGSYPHDFTESGNTLYFVANDGTTGFQIWSTDGTSAAAVTSFANTDYGSINDLTDVNGTLFFPFGDTPNATLYKLDNGNATQVPLPSDGSGTDVDSLTNVDGTIFFSGAGAGGALPVTLFSSDGNTIQAVTGDPGTTPVELTDADGTLFYGSTDPSTGTELHTAAPGGSTTPPPSGPTVTITESAGSIREGSKQKITFTAVVSGGTGESFKWDFKNNGAYTVSSGKKDTIKASFSKTPPGNYPVAVQVLVNGSYITGETTLDIENVAPTVEVKNSPHHPKIGENVTFTAKWTDPGFTDTFTVLWTATNLATNNVVDSQTQSVGRAHATTFKDYFVFPSLYGVTALVTDSYGGSSSEGVTLDYTGLS